MPNNVNDCALVNFPKIQDPRGNLTFIEEGTHLPFDIERVYWIYDVPGGEERGGHAFKQQQEVIIALSGSFDVVLNDGKSEQVFHLNRAYYGLYVTRMVWREMRNFSTNSVAFVLADTEYNPLDYIYHFEEFLEFRESEGKH